MEETTISTPVETSSVDTSTSIEPTDVDTSSVEPTTEEVTAETETETTVEEPKLYAGKYKSVEELEKGYQETQKAFNERAELQKKYDALIAEQQAKEEKARVEALKQANQRGFDTVEAQEIADKVQVAELEYYANNMHLVAPEQYENVRNALANYYNTGHQEYLEQAKQFYSSEIIENVALLKNDIKNRLKSEFEAKNRQLLEQNEQKLANELKESYGEFLNSIKDNEAVSQALQIFCNTGHIQSREDMQVFVDLIGKIENTYKDKAIKEYLAQKTIEETKNKAHIEANPSVSIESNQMPTLEQINKMTQAQYEEAYAKYGDKLLLAN